TPPGAGLQRPAECAGRGRWPQASSLRRRLLAAAHRLRRALAGSRVRPRTLAVHRYAATVADAAVRADLAEALDRLRTVAAQVTLHLERLVDVLTQHR